MEKTVVFIGAGSVGSGVVELLCKVGVGRIILVDPDNLEPENASRHSLGVKPVLVKKADEFANELRRRFPHLTIDSHSIRWEMLNIRKPEVLRSADLIISTVGDWGVEGRLNAEARAVAGFPPTVFGWLENHAAAGHAVALFSGQGCLQCLLKEDGKMRIPVTLWDKPTALDIPMCGGAFQPYGAIELSHAHAIISELALEVLLGRVNERVQRSWIGQKKLLEGGGRWNPEWEHLHGGIGDGGKTATYEVIPDIKCPTCAGPT